MGRAVRLKDIADKTGFSTNTVSLALRGSPRLSTETRTLIRQAAAELNYLPNQIAKSLVSRSTKTIGLVLTDITNPVLTHTAQAIETALAQRGYGTLFATSNNRVADEIRAVELMRSRQVDGILIYPTSHRVLDHLRALRRTGMPIVLLVGDPDAGIDAVAMDERRGAYKAVRHLVEMGHRAIGMIDSALPLGNSEKREGCLKALGEAGLTLPTELVVHPEGHTVGHGQQAIAQLMSRPSRPSAVFAVTDSLAIGALGWCLGRGLAVPEQLAIAGFDNIEFAEYAPVPLTSVDYAFEAVTAKAVGRLMQLIEAGDELPEPVVTQIEPELMVRHSTRAR